MIVVGFASVDITPAFGADIPGGFSPRHATGTLDPLGVHACVIAGGTALAVVGVDAVSIPGRVVQQARAAIAAQGSLSPEAVLIAASHTHCGGPSNDVLGTDADPEYQNRIAGAIAQAVAAAWSQRVPATLAIGSASCPGWAFNRRWIAHDGSERTNPGKNNPDVIRPAGPVDDEVSVIVCCSPAGDVLGYIGNFACHSTVIGGSQFSADYSAYWREALSAPLVFLNGACGDVNQIDFSSPNTKESGIDHAKAMGQALAEATQRALAGASPLDAPQLSHRHQSLTLRLRIPTAGQQAADQSLVEAAKADWKAPHWQARDRLLMLEELGGQTTLSCKASVYQIGPALIPAAPWQPFCEFGLRLKQGSGARHVLPATFANGMIGYVPTVRGFAGGGYEPTLCRGSKLVPEAGEAILEALLHLVTNE